MINPLVYTEKVVRSFLRYQLTTYPFADQRLNTQMRKLLSLDETRHTPLLKGPYISLSRAFAAGVTIDQLIKDGLLHPHLKNIVNFPSVYGHQEEAIRAIQSGKTTLISTGTGSGKSECFLYPIISRCLELRDQKAPPGICAVIVYPMNALAEDQLGRMRELLAGSGIPFGMYVGKTPEKEADVTGVRLKVGSSRLDYQKEFDEIRKSASGASVHPFEEVCSREIMRTSGKQPRILLTNVKQLELLLTRQKDIELFDGARLDYLVFDEAHTFTGTEGAETACLIRRLRSYCGKRTDQTVCVATSATIFDANDPEAARSFAARFFGVEEKVVATVREVYETETWATKRFMPPAPKKPLTFLDLARQAIDAPEPAKALTAIFKDIDGTTFNSTNWEDLLYDNLSANDLLYQAAMLLEKPSQLQSLVAVLSDKVKRPVTEEELIAWLMMGAAARKGSRPLVRPVVHAFIRGVPGAVVTFEDKSNDPILYLSAEDDTDEKKLRLPILCCTTCGQHYFEHFLGDFEFQGAVPGGGIASVGSRYWETVTKEHSGVRLLLVDRLICLDDGDESESNNIAPIYLCRSCGAGHAKPEPRCHACGAAGEPLKLLAVQQKADHPGLLSTCACCGAHGRMFAGKYREPARPVRAVNVSDVHVLAQDMVQHAERKRLLVFADNRQDAAFQAGWMRDHARRFRIRSLIAQELKSGHLSIGDIVYRIDKIMEADDALSMTLLPELWSVVPTKEAAGNEHRNERKYLLRILVLLELTISARQIVGLEPWGRIKVNYIGLDEASPFVQKWAKHLKLPADELVGGVAAFLDQLRRRKILYDSLGEIFSKIWSPGTRELENGFLPPLPGVPVGIKFTRDATDNKNWVMQLFSPGHQTTASQIAKKWGINTIEVQPFLQDLWDWLRSSSTAILVPVTLKGSKGKALPQCTGTYQINSDRFQIAGNAAGSYRCKTCRQQSVRRTPEMKCLAWQCDGELEHVPEDTDNYDLQLLDGNYGMLRPREHTAMVQTAEREKLEHIFKGDSDAINTLVCTQTLELGVDIGWLDAILMRNVPPQSANYWQRTGRAGRRHRMAVDFTYCRLVNHDRAYFKEPEKMLNGHINPPSFNLSNDFMVKKHVHATVLTALQSLSRSTSILQASEREEIALIVRRCFPTFISEYLFDQGKVMAAPQDMSSLRGIIEKHRIHIEQVVLSAFRQGWPVTDALVVDAARLTENVLGMANELEQVIKRLYRRLRWAMSQIEQLQNIQRKVGALDEEQKAFHDRCHRYISRIKNPRSRERNKAEGIDDVITLSVLAAEGFLPGYGLETGSIIGMAEVPRWIRGLNDFDLPRPPSVALREYVPGNLIYANGQRFVPRRYAREIGEDRHELIRFEVYPEHEAIQEIHGTGGGGTASVISSIPICDVTLVHQSRISDEEENRFQMSVAIYGRELGQHSGGVAFKWGARELQLRHGIRFQLVNVGAPYLITGKSAFGYPVCRICGQSVSPFASDKQKEDFEKKHKEWCNSEPKNIGFHTDLTADAIMLANCPNREEA